MHHPPEVGVDGASDPSVAGRLPALLPISLLPAHPHAEVRLEAASLSQYATPAFPPPLRSESPPLPQSFPLFPYTA